MRQSGLSAKQAKKGPATAMGKARAKAKAKEKGNPAEIEIGKEKGTLGNHLALTIAKAMAIASGGGNYRFSHDGPKGGKRKSTTMAPKSPRKSKRSR
jgi:hypothetical protein